MGHNTRIYNQWQGYTTADVACEYCLYYAGARKGCRLTECFCMEDRLAAERRESVADEEVIRCRE